MIPTEGKTKQNKTKQNRIAEAYRSKNWKGIKQQHSITLPPITLKNILRKLSDLLHQHFLFMYLFLAVLSGVHCPVVISLGAMSKGYSCCGAQASLVEEQGLQGERASEVAVLGPQSTDLIIVAPGFSCSPACGIVPDQGSNLCLLHWQADFFYH